MIPTADNNNDSRHVLKLKISGFTISSSVACVILLSCNLTTYLTFLRFDRGAHLKKNCFHKWMIDLFFTYLHDILNSKKRYLALYYLLGR